jgi:hypothetical protein
LRSRRAASRPLALTGHAASSPRSATAAQGLTLAHVRAQLEQLQDTFMSQAGSVDRRAQVKLKSERV